MLFHNQTACRPPAGRQAVFDKRGIRPLIFGTIAAALLALIDQLIKLWVVRDFALGESRAWLHIGKTELMRLTYVLNDGVAFSALAGKRIIITAIPFVLLAVCVLGLLRFGRESKLVTCGIAMCMGGGIGNLIDRLFNGGEVIDYLDLQLFDFAVFNFADCCICIGVALAGIYLLFLEGRGKQEATAPTDAKPEQDHV